MASLYRVKRKNGQSWKIDLLIGKKRTTITLGTMSKKAAALCLSMIEQIQSANVAGQSLPVEVADWTKNIGDDLHKKLVKVGLLKQRQRRTVDDFLTGYIEERTDWGEATAAAFTTSKNLMVEFFGGKTPLETITVDDAVNFRLDLQKKKFADAYIAKIIRHSRHAFKIARRRKLITDNPFETVIAGSQRNPERLHFVTMDEYEKLLEGCTNAKQRLILCLARVGGLRCPSELCGLRWSEIDWTGKRFWVHSLKTKHHKGKDKRLVPLFPELERRFQEYFDTLPEGCNDLIFSEESKVPPFIKPRKSLSSWIQKVALRAGVKLWEKPFQNCRSTRDTELRRKHPQHLVNAWIGQTGQDGDSHTPMTDTSNAGAMARVPDNLVNSWIGHSQEIAEAHYLQPLDDDYIDAYNAEQEGGESAVESDGNRKNTVEGPKLPPTVSPISSMACNVIHCEQKTYSGRYGTRTCDP